MQKLFKHLKFNKKQSNNLYSAGFRFWYHKYYQSIAHQKVNVLYYARNGQAVTEENKGYLIGDWIINARYLNFKEEIN